ncbi:uvrA [Mytilus coruscus]|uniref:UvrA n=1 Tax=Mytilus coruscus TaxID=42192 RepID=A0A6J8AU75_MYTCO|nr:uvrA [Mytilus coruscus]
MKVAVISGFICMITGAIASGFCSFPCNLRGRSYKSNLFPDITTEFFADDPTGYNVTFTSTGTVFTGYCYARAGEFYAVRRRMDNKWQYSCAKDMLLDTTYDAFLYYITPWYFFPPSPTICDVCKGSGFFPEDLKELGCNIPEVCPVTDVTNQEQCDSCSA